jgi:hypothetical protein
MEQKTRVFRQIDVQEFHLWLPEASNMYNNTRNVEDRWRVKHEHWTVVMSTIPKRKYKRSDIEANYRNETKTFW